MRTQSHTTSRCANNGGHYEKTNKQSQQMVNEDNKLRKIIKSKTNLNGE